MLGPFPVIGGDENLTSSIYNLVISWESLIWESKKRSKEIRVDYEYI